MREKQFSKSNDIHEAIGFSSFPSTLKWFLTKLEHGWSGIETNDGQLQQWWYQTYWFFNSEKCQKNSQKIEIGLALGVYFIKNQNFQRFLEIICRVYISKIRWKSMKTVFPWTGIFRSIRNCQRLYPKEFRKIWFQWIVLNGEMDFGYDVSLNK